MIDVSGVIAAAITPRGNQGDVDFGATFELVDYLCAAGVRGIALFGATGELSLDDLRMKGLPLGAGGQWIEEKGGL